MKKNKIVVIDDKELVQESWRFIAKNFLDYDFCFFNHPLDFFLYCKYRELNHESFKLILADQVSPGHDALQNQFAISLKGAFPNIKCSIILCSSLYNFEQPFQPGNGFDLGIGKDLISNETLEMLLNLKFSR